MVHSVSDTRQLVRSLSWSLFDGLSPNSLPTRLCLGELLPWLLLLFLGEGEDAPGAAASTTEVGNIGIVALGAAAGGIIGEEPPFGEVEFGEVLLYVTVASCFGDRGFVGDVGASRVETLFGVPLCMRFMSLGVDWRFFKSGTSLPHSRSCSNLAITISIATLL